MASLGWKRKRAEPAQERLVGTLMEWNGEYGIIQPTPELTDEGSNGGLVLLYPDAVSEDLPSIGCTVSFLLGSTDDGSFQALECKPHGEAAEEASESQRELLVAEPVTGILEEWKGSYGWIKPSVPIEGLTSGGARKGRVYLALADITEDLQEGVGSLVSFKVYQDEKGVGALECRPSKKPVRGGAAIAPPASFQGPGQTKTTRWAPAAKVASNRQSMKGGRRRGRVIEWNGKTGWIWPEGPLDHPSAALHAGKVYMAIEDVEQDFKGVGAQVEFLAYADEHGVGAAQVRLAGVSPQDRFVSSQTPEIRHALRKSAAAILFAHGKGAQVVAPQRSGVGYGAPQVGYGATKAKGSVGGQTSWQTGGKLQTVVKAAFQEAHPELYDDPAAKAELQEKVRAALEAPIEEAATQVIASGLEEVWSQAEVSKRLMRYISGSSLNNLTALTWEEAVPKYVSQAVSNSAAALSDRAWFHMVDLEPTFTAAAFEVAQGLPSATAVDLEAIREIVQTEYTRILEAKKLDKAIWGSITATFPEWQESMQSKLFKALSSTRQLAADEAMQEPEDEDALCRVKAFTRIWMHHACTRAWTGLQDSQHLLNEQSVTNLFKLLMCPFGPSESYCSVPEVFTATVGRPPKAWDFLRPTARDLFQEWSSSNTASRNRKKKKPRTDAEGDAPMFEEEAAGDEFGISPHKVKQEYFA